MTLLLTVPVAVFVGTATVSAWIITCSGVVLTVSDSVRTARSEGLHTAVAPNGRLHAYVSPVRLSAMSGSHQRLQSSVEPSSRRNEGTPEGALMTLELISPPGPTALPVEEDEGPPGFVGRAVTAVFVGVPFLALVFGVIRFWGRGIHLRDVLLAAVFYLLIGHGISIGFHRLLAHRLVHCPPSGQALARRAGLDGVRGGTDQLGGQPPPAPRLR